MVAAVGGAVLSHPPWLAPYSIVGGLGRAPIDTLRQVGHSVYLGILARPNGYSVQRTLRHPCLCLLKSIVKGTLYFTSQLLSPLLHYSPAWNVLTTSDLTWRLPCSLSPGSRGGSPTFTTDKLSDTSYFIHHGLTTNYISIQNTIWRPARQVRHSGFTVNIRVWYAN